MNIFVSAVIVAAGSGKRFGGGKQAALLGGRPVLERALESFQKTEDVSEVILVLPPGGSGEALCRRFPKITRWVPGGSTRQDSVRAGFAAVDGSRADIVLVHDGARPRVSRDLILRVIRAADVHGAAVPVIAVEDTVKSCRDGKIVQTLDRAALCRAQTPQGFRYGLLARALEDAARAGFFATDDAALVEAIGETVFTVPGDPLNIKITTPLDIAIAEACLDD